MQKDIQWYIKRGGGNKHIIGEIITTMIKLMTPFTPHLAEELWHMNHSSLVSTDDYPSFDDSKYSESEEVNEYLIQQLINDSQEILNVTGISPKKICFYIAPQWKHDLYKKGIRLYNNKEFNIGLLMKDAMANPDLRALLKVISREAAKLAGEIKKFNDTDRNRYLSDIDEYTFLTSEKAYLEKNFSCPIEVYMADNEKKYDPLRKAQFAEPLRPAIFIE
jgi:leucyl-tRNA synthetase